MTIIINNIFQNNEFKQTLDNLDNNYNSSDRIIYYKL